MTRKFKLRLIQIDPHQQIGDGPTGGDDDMAVCGVGISGKGVRFNFAPINIPNKGPGGDTNRFDVNPPRIIYDIDTPLDDTNFLFCFWCYERDNESLKEYWSDVIRTFNFWMDRKNQELQSFRYPTEQKNFQAFMETNLEYLHDTVKSQADRKKLGFGDGDDVYNCFIIKASHLGGTPPFIDINHLKKEYIGTADGSLLVRGSANHTLYFDYKYSKVSDVVAMP